MKPNKKVLLGMTKEWGCGGYFVRHDQKVALTREWGL